MIEAALGHREFFHIGSAVPSLRSAMVDLSSSLGVGWAAPYRRTGAVMTRIGPVHRDMWITYSAPGPIHLELIEYVDDEAYRHMTGGPPQHHIGFWSDTFHADIARLESLGMPCEASGVDDAGRRTEFAYHRDPHTGMWIELVDTAGRRVLQKWTSRPVSLTA
ncbi:hypothetical protein BJF78_00565 [Pseudonocardia sp. CNS-139]|nr:hypothetical protein BJF78_00565 [Pseudonocardia sp. CNS-139]